MNPFIPNEQFNPLHDIAAFHEKFGLGQNLERVAIAPECTADDDDTIAAYQIANRDRLSPEEWDLRHKRLNEEIEEYNEAVEDDDDELAFDSLIDLVYIALGTCYRRGWNFSEGWKRVHAANMSKERGKKHNSKYGSTYDIVKPENFKAPHHHDLV